MVWKTRRPPSVFESRATGLSFDYQVRIFRRSRRLRLHVRADGSVLVTVPARAPEALIRRFVTDHAAWVEQALQTSREPSPSAFPRLTPTVREQARRDTRILVAHRLAHFNRVYQLTWKRIFVRNQRRSWGSCSKAGNLNFNLRLALLAPGLADYVIVHELCHRQHFNHSKDFWSLVAKTIPDYKERRRALKKYRLT